MPKKIEISQEIIKSCIEMHSQLWGYSRIGRELGIDRRKVADIIRNHEKAKILRDIGSARRDVAGAYFKQHIEKLGRMGKQLLGLTLPPRLRDDLTPVPEDVWFELQKWAEYFFIDEGYLQNTPSLNDYIVRVTAEIRVNSLKSHIPSLLPLIKEWELKAKGYNSTFQDGVPELKKLSESLGIRSDLIEPGLLTTFGLLSEQVLILKDELADRPLVDVKSSNDVAHRLSQSGEAIRQLKSLLPHLVELERCFKKIASVLSPDRLPMELMLEECEICAIPILPDTRES